MTTANNIVDLGQRRPKRFPDLELKRRALLGELVIATGAGDLSLDVLAGVLLSANETSCAENMETWRLRGELFFAYGQSGA